MNKQEVLRRMQKALGDDVVSAVQSPRRTSLFSELTRMRTRLGKSIKKRLKKVERLISTPFRRLRDRILRHRETA